MNKYKLFLLIVFIAVLIWSGINPPVGRADWLLENIPIFAAMIIFSIFAYRLKLSSFSYTLIVIYLMLCLIASHYGVAGVPWGNTLGRFLGTTRNMYDRLVHFMFGFLGFYPIHEFVIYINKKESIWNYYIPLIIAMASTAVYEIFEWLAAVTVDPVLAASFYGAQGDIFDTQEDMAMVGTGAICALIIVFLFQKYRKNIRTANTIPENQ
jgi:putative membrane protein